MKYGIRNYIVWYSILHNFPILSIASIVYNYRIAQVTKRVVFEKSNNKRHYTLLPLFFNQYQKKQDNITQNFLGGLGSFIYAFEPFFFRIDVAGSYVKATQKDMVAFSGARADDVLFTVGYTVHPISSLGITLSALGGVPTHDIGSLQHVDFGYGQFGVGMQGDLAYTFCDTYTLLLGARYIYFVPRMACASDEKRYKFSDGNIGDLLFAYKQRWDQHGLEVGYTFRANFGAQVKPAFDDIVEKVNYIRNNFYAVYNYKFAIDEVANNILLNIAYGFDSKKAFSNKYIITFWAAWSINF